MADKKITALTALTGATLATTDHFVVVDVSDTTMALSGTVKRMTAAEAAIGIRRLGSYFSVKDYGATGDGVTDDTTAVQAAITASAAAPGGVCFFPSGTYIVSPLTIPPAAALQGVTGQGYYNATSTVPNSANISRLKLKAASTGALISPNDGGTNLSCHVRLADLALDCNAIAQPAINLPDLGSGISRFWRMERLYVVNVGAGGPGYGVYIGNLNTACTMRDCVMFNGTSGSPAGSNAVGWYGSDGVMDGCFIGYWGGTGLNVLGGANDGFLLVRGGGIFTCSTGVAVGGNGAVFEGVSIDHNFNDGAYVAYPVTFIGCWFHTNSRTTNNTWSNIRVVNPVVVNVIGCRATARDSGVTSNIPAYHIDAGVGVILNEFGNSIAAGLTFGTSYTNYVGTVTAPTFPASTVAVQNTIGADVQAFVANSASAAITVVTLGATATGMTIPISGTAVIRIPYGQTIAFTYASGTPTWKWVIG